MADNRNKKHNANLPKDTTGAPSVKAVERDRLFHAGATKTSTHALIMVGIAALCWFFLRSGLSNQFTNWDDPGYIQDDNLIKNLSFDGLKAMFSTPVMGNYHPITILSYAIEYGLSGLDPWLYYFDNVLLHVLDTLLVYWLVIRLTQRPIAAVVTALLFGLHPMHVESAMWISERKDVLYVFFYLSACLAYISYADGRNKSVWYAIGLLFFLLSVLSKPVAVTLPVTLLLIDFLKNRKINAGVLIEKIPYFLISIAFGIVALKVQHTAGAMAMQTIHYTPVERLALGCYALVTYLWKAILPIGLCNVYAYPLKVNGVLPFVYYLYPLCAIAVTALVWRFGRRSKIVVFGTLFFIVNIALLLQFIQVGDAIIAERYSYLAYLGLFFIGGWYVSEYLRPGNAGGYRNVVAGGVGAYMLILFFMSGERAKVWHDSISLWTDAIEKDPLRNVGGYNNLGFIYYQKWSASGDQYEKGKFYDSARYFLDKSIAIAPEFVNPYISLGEMERTVGQYEEAKKNYRKALSYHPKDPNMYLGMAILNYFTKDMDSAGVWFRGAIQVDPSAQAYGNYANFLNMTGKPDSSLFYYGVAITKAPEMYANYLNRSRVYRDLHRPDEAIIDLNVAIRINPDASELYYERSLSYSQKGDRAQALHDIEDAIAKGYNRVDQNYYQSLKR